MMHKRLVRISVAGLTLVSLCAVCASTGVIAKNSAGAPMNGLDSGTAVCSWGAGRLDVFATGTDGALWHKWWDGNWHSWESLGRPMVQLTSAPTAVSWGAGRIDVFASAGYGDLFHKWFDKGWHDWEYLGHPDDSYMAADTAPAACSWGNNRLDIFVAGSNGQLWQKWFDNGWHDWVPLGKPSTAYLDGSPAALSTVSWGYPRVDVFVRGTDGALWQLWWKNGWQPWHRFDDTAGLLASDPSAASGGNTAFGTYDYAPTACSWGANRLDVFFVNVNGYLEQKWFNGDWQPLYLVGGYYYMSASPSAVAWQLGTTTRIDIFSRGYDYALWQKYFAGGWYGWYNLGLLY